MVRAFQRTLSRTAKKKIVPSLDLVVWKLGGRDGQYSPRDTGLATHPMAAREAKPRAGWKETIDVETAKRATLQNVVSAIVERRVGHIE